MQTLTSCPGCGGTRLHRYSRTVDAERRPSDLHFMQDRCTACDLVFSNPVADADELNRYYAAEYYEQWVDDFGADRPDLLDAVRRRPV